MSSTNELTDKTQELRARFIIPSLPPIDVRPIAIRRARIFIVYCEGYGAMECRDGELYFTSILTPFLAQKEAVDAIRNTKEGRLVEFGREFEDDFGKLRILSRRIEV